MLFGVWPKSKQKIMKIKIIRNTVAQNKRVQSGEVVEVTDSVGNTLIALGKAVVYENRAKALDETEKPSVTTREKAGAKPKK